jgi:hypothetical protein
MVVWAKPFSNYSQTHVMRGGRHSVWFYRIAGSLEFLIGVIVVAYMVTLLRAGR